jgi:ribosomal protein S21
VPSCHVEVFGDGPRALGKALRALKREVNNAGVMRELAVRRGHLSPGAKRRHKAIRARRRLVKAQRQAAAKAARRK